MWGKFKIRSVRKVGQGRYLGECRGMGWRVEKFSLIGVFVYMGVRGCRISRSEKTIRDVDGGY